jgi:hypothetical protein
VGSLAGISRRFFLVTCSLLYWLENRLENRYFSCYSAISERLMTARVKCKHRNLTIIQVKMQRWRERRLYTVSWRDFSWESQSKMWCCSWKASIQEFELQMRIWSTSWKSMTFELWMRIDLFDKLCRNHPLKIWRNTVSPQRKPQKYLIFQRPWPNFIMSLLVAKGVRRS